jgi:hypothetical protein
MLYESCLGVADVPDGGGCLARFRVLEQPHRPDYRGHQCAAHISLLYPPALWQWPHLDRVGARIVSG